VFSTIVYLAFVFAFAFVSKLDSIIHIALSQFAAFRQKKINDLIEKDVFQSVSKNDVSSDVCIFNLRFMNEIKHSDIDKAFEKSRRSADIQRSKQEFNIDLIVNNSTN
jgi:hypothetical protein